MADISTELQSAIASLQSKNDSLIQAVRDYRGGSVATAANDLIKSQATAMAAINAKESTLLGLVNQNATVPQPSMILDFATGIYMRGDGRVTRGYNLDDMVSNTRSTVATYVNKNRQLATAPANEIRFTYDPSTGEAQGVLVESGTTNQIAYSEDFTKWGNAGTGATAGSITVTTPDGGQNGFQIGNVPNSGNAILTYPSGGIDSGDNYVLSVWARTSVSNRKLIITFGTGALPGEAIFNLTTGTVESGDAHIEKWNNGWYRCTWFVTATGNSNAPMHIGAYNPGTGKGNGVQVFGAQLAKDDWQSSYIWTTGSPGTRATDRPYVVFGDEYVANTFSVVAHYEYQSENGNELFGRGGSCVFRMYRNNNNYFENQITLGRFQAAGKSRPNQLDFSMRDRYGNGFDKGSITNTNSNLDGYGPFRSAVSVSETEVLLASGDAPVSTYTTGERASLKPFDGMFLGMPYSGAYMFGVMIRSLVYYPRALTADELLSLTDK